MKFRKVSNIIALAIEDVKKMTFEKADKSDMYYRVEQAIRHAVELRLDLETYGVKKNWGSMKSDANRSVTIIKHDCVAECTIGFAIKLKQDGYKNGKMKYNLKDIETFDMSCYDKDIDEVFDYLELCRLKSLESSKKWLEEKRDKAIKDFEAILNAMKNNEPIPSEIYVYTLKDYVQDYSKLLALK